MSVYLLGWWTAMPNVQVHLRREARWLSGWDNVISGHQQPAAWVRGLWCDWDRLPFHERLSGIH